MRRIPLFLVGLLLILASLLQLSYLYTIASVVSPEFEGIEFWSKVALRMFNFSNGGVLTVFTLVTLMAGMWCCIYTLAARDADK